MNLLLVASEFLQVDATIGNCSVLPAFDDDADGVPATAVDVDGNNDSMMSL